MSHAWWQRGVLYQVYPRSFQDTNGDGIGDLRGIEARLDHFVTLGVDALWLSPIFPSPMVDFGYDVADYCDVDQTFGSLEDLDRLIAAAHHRRLKVLLDFVPNHTSNEHPWFLASKSSRTDPKRDWYIWRDAAPDGGPPNNWISDFGGSSWTWDAATEQYYLHAFLPEQPDLDWRNPAVREAMFDVLRFWLARGIDGFRIDVLWHIVKAAGLPDNPVNPAWREGMADMLKVEQQNSTDQPEVHAIAAEMRRIADGFGERLLIGEIYLPPEKLVRYYGQGAPGVHLPFNFQLIDAPWNARDLAERISRYEALLPEGAWPNWVLGNHDRPRIAARVGHAQARVAAMLLLTLRGTPTLYYGDELGIAQVDVPADCVRDPRELREPGLGFGRDPVRTPMAWDASENAGFTEGTPWLPLHADWRQRNVRSASEMSGSLLELHRSLLALRRAHDALAIGAIVVLDAQPGAENVLAYERHHEGKQLLVMLNLGAMPQMMTVPSWAHDFGVLASTRTGGVRVRGGRFALRADEGVVLGATT